MGSGSFCESCLFGIHLGWTDREGPGTPQSPSAPRIKAWGPSDKVGSPVGAQHGFISWTIPHDM